METLDELPQPAYEGTVATDALETDGDNPNEMSDEQFGLLKDRMRQNGWLGGPIVTNTDGLIADGEHRWRAADAIGLEEVPVRQYDIDDATRRLWRQELNKIHGEHDTKRDALEYDYLLDAGKADEVHELTQAADEDLDELLAEIKLETSASPAYEYDPDHNVYFEDCVEGMRERLDDDSVDCVITDPPYGVDWDTNSRDKEKDLPGTVANDGDIDEAIELWDAVIGELRRVLTDDGHLYAFADWRTEHAFRTVLENYGFDIRNVLVWDKGSMGLGGVDTVNYRTQYELCIFATLDNPRMLEDRGPDVHEHERIDTDRQAHPTEKPVGLVARYVNNSTREGDRILDPFMGSGTTAVAAIQNDREYVGFEVDAENYRDVIERRIGEAKRQREAGVNADA
ncbi:N6-adenine methyltransferase [Halorubrum tailed virus 28]|uniref:N6-adenine methyltransferase n=1 Tax=Halorubrum tailed virus 28 TaxID=2878009 RepID=A0AAE8Y0X3_9CAUD|nr:DNA methyltransferase [Halorubrum tailed virus 28]UBF23509.1 N6-adenine methyltransferase [Halorubrum tailed virus 28]